jgi:hypothetical protein
MSAAIYHLLTLLLALRQAHPQPAARHAEPEIVCHDEWDDSDDSDDSDDECGEW